MSRICHRITLGVVICAGMMLFVAGGAVGYQGELTFGHCYELVVSPGYNCGVTGTQLRRAGVARLLRTRERSVRARTAVTVGRGSPRSRQRSRFARAGRTAGANLRPALCIPEAAV